MASLNWKNRSCGTGVEIQSLWSPSVCVPLQQLFNNNLDFPFLSSKSSGWLQKECLWRSVAWVCRPCRQQDLMGCLRHGVAIAPTVQRNQQPVSQDLLARVFWEFQHVDAVESTEKEGEVESWSNFCGYDDICGWWRSCVVFYLKERAATVYITCCTLEHAETSPCFQTLLSVLEDTTTQVQLHWRDILPSSAQSHLLSVPQLRLVERLELSLYVCLFIPYCLRGLKEGDHYNA